MIRRKETGCALWNIGASSKVTPQRIVAKKQLGGKGDRARIRGTLLALRCNKSRGGEEQRFG